MPIARVRNVSPHFFKLPVVKHGRLLFRREAYRCYASAPSQNVSLNRTRNIGIIAHIDAGKTTTTERMLYYSGYTRRIGDVDEGSTVTDFLPAERARGITIQSAAITLQWPPGPVDGAVDNSRAPPSTIPHEINLIDTPGHADFTFEVLRSLRVLDGAVCILDGVAGVEAQTENVWSQASQYQIPRMIFINKLDRDGAAFARTTKEIAARLHVWPALCHIPWWDLNDKSFCGIGDVVNLRAIRWERGSDGRSLTTTNLDDLQNQDPKFAEELRTARAALVELLSAHDDELVESFLEHNEDHLAIPASDILKAMRSCTLQSPQRVVPVFAGASFRNIGVQPLMDGIVDLLPSPLERPSTKITVAGTSSTLDHLLSGNLPSMEERDKKRKQPTSIQNLTSCALAFKVVNDAKRGVLVYVRVYSGSLKQGSILFNTGLGVSERAQKVLRMYASDATEIPSIEAGHIGVIIGLKHARTGDTLLTYTGMNTKSGPPSPLNNLQLRPIHVPPPVFFTSIEPESQSEEKPVQGALDILLREDPSLTISTDPESGQTLLAGMGELHLEIARDRLIKDLKARARSGRIEIGYREALTSASSKSEATIEREIAGKMSRATIVASVEPLRADDDEVSRFSDNEQYRVLRDGNILCVRHSTMDRSGCPAVPDTAPLPEHLTMESILVALEAGAAGALAKGPVHAFPLHSTKVVIHLDPGSQLSSDASPGAITIASRQAIQAAVKSVSQGEASALMEPVMMAKISVTERDLGPVVQDLNSARGGQIISLGDDDAAQTSGCGDNAPAHEHGYVDPRAVYVPSDPFATSNEEVEISIRHQLRQITARVPLREMIGYLKQLRSLTGGRGTFVMQVDRFEAVTGQRLKRALSEIRGCL